MKLHPEDPRLTALLLGELPADEAAEIERAIAADPALQLAFQELEQIQRFLSDSLADGEKELYPRQRDAVLNAARYADRSGKPIPLASNRRKLRNILVPLAAAAVLTLGVIQLLKLPATSSKTAEKSKIPEPVAMEIALLPAPGPVDHSSTPASPTATASSSLIEAAKVRREEMQTGGDLFLREIAERLATEPLPDAAKLPPLTTRGMVSADEHSSIALPILAGHASLSWITHSIREKRTLPPPNAVRLEEILNHFSLRPAGAAAVAAGVTLSVETLPCPWKPSATLLLVSMRGAKQGARDVTATFHAFPAAVRSYRLLGYSPVDGLPSGHMPSHLPEQSITSLVIEIEPAAATGDLGTIQWTVGGRPAPAVSIAPASDSEPSNDARFAALACTYALWLIGDQRGMLDAELLAALARENATESLPPNRADFLNLIDQSINR